jgi:NTP pyrophosphatase (non-canonical NTP hydrolase)
MADPRYDRPELSPSLTERQKVVLVRIMEEAAEVQQAAAKTLRWGLDSVHPVTRLANRDQIQAEFGDLCQFVSELLL